MTARHRHLDEDGQPDQGPVPSDERTLQLDLPILLPEVQDDQDQCIRRLIERVEARKGVTGAHVVKEDHHEDPTLAGAEVSRPPAKAAASDTSGRDHAPDHDHDHVDDHAHPHQEDQAQEDGVEASLCIHYDPSILALREITRIVESAGGAVTDRYKHEILWVRGMDCADCSLSIEHVLDRQDGILEVSVNYAAEKARLEYDSQAIDRDHIVDLIDSMGYQVDERDQPYDDGHGPLGGLALPIASGITLAVAFFGQWLFGLPFTYALPFYLVAYLTGGWEAFQHAVAAVRNLELDIEALMVVAAIGAAALGHWAEGALLLFLFSLGHALEHMAMDKARDAIGALGELTPQSARVRRDGQEQEIPVEALVRGDTVVVRPGERIPIDGEITQGTSAVDQSAITGESVPVEKATGDEVFAGTVNGQSTLEVEVTKLAKDTTISRVIEMVEEAQTQKSPTQRFSETLESRFAPAVFALTLAVIALPPLLLAGGPWVGNLSFLGYLSLPWQESLLRGLTILVAASPCALAISTPAAILSGIGKGARNGVLVKGGVHLENLATVNAVAFDKTGTITFGQPEVVDIVPMDGIDEDGLLQVAASVEARSEHPLAKAVVRKAETRGLTLDQAGELQSITGKGVVSDLEGQQVEIGNLRLFRDNGHEVPEDVLAEATSLEEEGKTTMIVRRGGAYLGVIALADQARDEARQVVTRLKELGVEHVIMLTGDNERVAKAIAEEVGFTEHQAELLPEDKVQAVKDLRARFGSVAMVGDGVNDAPAMAQSTVGVAMGAGGTDVALETADVALMGDRIDRFPFAYELSRRTRGIIKQNLVISLGVIAVLVPLAALGLAGIAPAIVVHEGSTLLVVGNALRLLGGPTG